MTALRRQLVAASVFGLGLILTGQAFAQDAERRQVFSFYAQQAFPNQTNTNQQIEDINDTLGTNFDTWDDIANLSIGAKYFWRFSPNWLAGIEVDYSRGGIDGSEKIAGPARADFEQTYSIFTDVMLAAHYFPCARCSVVQPFVLAGAGYGYEKDTTRLRIHNASMDQKLVVRNSGWFPVATLGLGFNAHVFPDRSWFIESGVAYFWGRLDHKVDAKGSLAPAPRVRADNDTNGPNYWLGFGKEF